jgi:hypothetical protein
MAARAAQQQAIEKDSQQAQHRFSAQRRPSPLLGSITFNYQDFRYQDFRSRRLFAFSRALPL